MSRYIHISEEYYESEGVIYSMNTYTCPKYSCIVLVEISMYFELQKKAKIMATYRLRFMLEIYLFCIA
jgi:hypothetical protein